MTITMHQASVPVFARSLRALSAILDKAAEQAAARGLDEGALMQARLAPDMFTLSRQVQIATDHAKGAPARLAGVDVPKLADDETSFAELKERIARVCAFVESLEPVSIDGSEERDIALAIGSRTMTFKGQAYLLDFALPNFFFHVTAAYAILRHNGIEIGKRDFLGPF